MKHSDMKKVLDHSMVTIAHDIENNAYLLFIKMLNGKIVMQQPYPSDQRGLIGAMQLALDVLAGKVLLVSEVESNDTTKPELPKLLELNSRNF